MKAHILPIFSSLILALPTALHPVQQREGNSVFQIYKDDLLSASKPKGRDLLLDDDKIWAAKSRALHDGGALVGRPTDWVVHDAAGDNRESKRMVQDDRDLTVADVDTADNRDMRRGGRSASGMDEVRTDGTRVTRGTRVTDTGDETEGTRVTRQKRAPNAQDDSGSVRITGAGTDGTRVTRGTRVTDTGDETDGTRVTRGTRVTETADERDGTRVTRAE